MRYLKVIAQDRRGNGKADAVLLEFREQTSVTAEDSLVRSAFAVDFTADGKVDFKLGDVTGDGKESAVDQRLLESFANTVLQFNWFNPGFGRTRYLKIFADDVRGDGTPDAIRLQLRRESKRDAEGEMLSWSAAFDRDNDGKIDSSYAGDANGDGQIDQIDDRLVQQLAQLYLKFKWA